MLTAPVRAHHRDLGRRPREREVGADRLRVHDDVRAAVRLARDDLHPRHGRLAVRVQQLGAVADDAAVLLVGAGQEAGHVDERDERDVERVARAHEARRLLRRVDVEGAREHLRLVADDADDVTVDAGEAAHDVHRPRTRCTSKNSPSSTTSAMTFFMSYGLLGESGMRSMMSSQTGVGSSVGLEVRRVLEVVRREERQQVAHLLEARSARRRRRTSRRPTSTRASSRRRAPPG